MSTTYTQAEGDVHGKVRRVIDANRQELKDAQVTVDVVFAFNEDGGAVMLHGYQCAAVVKKISYKNRVMGRSDSEITIDKDWWDDATPRQQDALLDHELTHLVVVYDKAGKPKKDRAGRPKLQMRLHDWQLGGFADTSRRYGKDAPEVLLARQFKEKFGQLVFDFVKGSKGEAA